MLLSSSVVTFARTLGVLLVTLAAEEDDFILQDVKYIWPVMTWTVPLTPASGNGLAPISLADKLVDIAESAFDKYSQEVLPLELEADAAFKMEFEAADASRMNQGFLRWQKRVYADMKKVPLHELSWDGNPIPRYDKISYKWVEFYKSKEYKEFRKHIERLAGMYLSHMDRRQQQGNRIRFRTFIWAEIYRPKDSHRPITFTGAPVAGVYFARYSSSRQGAQKFSFEDPRGINPPFGKTHNHQPRQGDVLMHPSWSSNFLTPHPLNSTNVLFRFVCWPPDGPSEFDWEDDASGDFIYSKQFKIKKPQSSTKRKEAEVKTEL